MHMLEAIQILIEKADEYEDKGKDDKAASLRFAAYTLKEALKESQEEDPE